MHPAGLKIELAPAQNDKLRDAQPMPKGGRMSVAITRTMPAHLARGLQELLDLIIGGEILP
jgi:hypothetical protein